MDLQRIEPEDLEARLTTPYEKVLTTLMDNIEHIEPTIYNGSAVIKIFLQPRTGLDRVSSQVVGAYQSVLRFLPLSTQPPEPINFSASSVPILQLGLSGKGLAERQLNDLALNFVWTQLITVPGTIVPLPYGGEQRGTEVVHIGLVAMMSNASANLFVDACFNSPTLGMLYTKPRR